MSKLSQAFLIIMFMAIPVVGIAHNRVVVIPMDPGTNAQPISNIVTVGLKNADFTNPAAAMSSITNASANNPYLLFIGPGTYTLGQTLNVKPNVHIAGAGVDVTILEAGFGSSVLASSAVISTTGAGSDRNSIRDLSINQFGFASQLSSGIFTDGPTLIENVAVNVRSTGESNYGIYTNRSSAVVNASTIRADRASGFNIALYVNSNTTVNDNRLFARNGSISVGIFNDGALLEVNNTISTASRLSGTLQAWGFFSSGSSNSSGQFNRFVTTQNSNDDGGSCSVATNSRALFKFTDIFTGCVGAGVTQCAFSTSNVAELNATCRLP